MKEINVNGKVKTKNKFLTCMSDKVFRNIIYELIEGINILPMLKIIDFDMVKIRNICYHNDAKGIDKLYRYIGMFIADKKLLKKLSKGDELLMEYEKEVVNLNEKNMFYIPEELDEEMYINAIRDFAFEDGEKRGEKIGEKRGKKKGILETARKMLNKGFEKSVISEVTGLSISQINKLIELD